MKKALLEGGAPILVSNLTRAIDTGILMLLPFLLKYPKAFPTSRKFQVMSDLQELSNGTDAACGEDRDEDGEEIKAIPEHGHVQYRKLYDGLPQADRGITHQEVGGLWESVHLAASAMYAQRNIDSSMNDGEENLLFVDRRAYMKEQLLCRLFDVVEKETQAPGKEPPHELIIFGHSMWMKAMFELTGSSECEWYAKNKIGNCGMVEFKVQRSSYGFGKMHYEIVEASPLGVNGYLAWDDKAGDEEVDKVAAKLAEPIKDMKQALDMRKATTLEHSPRTSNSLRYGDTLLRPF